MPLDLYDPVFLSDPYPQYQQLREVSPLLRLTEPSVWLMSRHADVNDALRKPEVFSSAQGVAFHHDAGGGSLVAADDPDHGRLRRLLNKQFTPRSVASLERDVRAITGELVGGLGEDSRAFDFAATIAAELPTRVIAHYLGIDPDDWRTYKRWSDVINTVIWSPIPTLELITEAAHAGSESVAFFEQHIKERRESPSEDLIGLLVAAADTNEALSDHEIVQFCFLLMLAGHVTTSSVLSHSVLLLLAHPEQQEALRQDSSLIPAAIEEVIRFESPIQGFMRTVTQDVTLHGNTMREGDKVMLLFGAANRDAAVFPDADRFDIRREQLGHVAFGAGPHFCLGSWLARLEVRILLEALLPRMSTWALDPDRPVVRVESPAFREISNLPVTTGKI